MVIKIIDTFNVCSIYLQEIRFSIEACEIKEHIENICWPLTICMFC